MGDHPPTRSPFSNSTRTQPIPLWAVFQVGGVTILLDCGWDIHFDTALLEPLREVVKKVDLVLISHSDLEHLGVRASAERDHICVCLLPSIKVISRNLLGSGACFVGDMKLGLEKLVVFVVLSIVARWVAASSVCCVIGAGCFVASSPFMMLVGISGGINQ